MSRHIQRTTRTAPVFPRLSVPQVAALAEATHGKREFTFKEAIQVAELFARDTEQTQAANAIADTLNGRKPNSSALWCYYFGDVYDRLGKGGPGRKLLDVLGTTLLNGPEIPACTGYPDVPHDAEVHVTITHHEETKEFDVCHAHYAFQTPKGAKVTTTPVGKKL